MFSTIKKYILKKYLASHKPVRKKQIHSLNETGDIGIMCEITDEDSYKDIFRLFTQLQKRGCNVNLIGYTNGNQVPFYCLPQLAAEYFCNKNLNWYGLPNTVQINDFLNKEYDMLIDFNYRYYSVVETLLSLSKAKFIVGRETKCRHLYDLHLDGNWENNEKYLMAVDTYTRKLNGQ